MIETSTQEATWHSDCTVAIISITVKQKQQLQSVTTNEIKVASALQSQWIGAAHRGVCQIQRPRGRSRHSHSHSALDAMMACTPLRKQAEQSKQKPRNQRIVVARQIIAITRFDFLFGTVREPANRARTRHLLQVGRAQQAKADSD